MGLVGVRWLVWIVGVGGMKLLEVCGSDEGVWMLRGLK
jgi:hypothetical protein